MVTLSNDELGVTLLRVSPGMEVEAVSEWATRVSNHRSSEADSNLTAEVYLTLGRNDVAIVHAVNLKKYPTLCVSSLPGVVCEKELDCYVWAAGTAIGTVLEQSLCAMIFIRLNPDLRDRGGHCEVSLEGSLAAHVAAWKPRNAYPTMLGSFGRDSTLVMIGADNLSDLLLASEQFTKECRALGESTGEAILRESFTSIAAKWEDPMSGLEPLTNQYPIEPTRDNGDDPGPMRRDIEGASIAIELRCCTSDIYEVADLAEKEWNENLSQANGSARNCSVSVSVAYGPADLYFRFPLAAYRYFGNLIKDLHAFRKKCESVLLTTECRIELPFMREADKPPSRPETFLDNRKPTARRVDLTEAEAAKILSIHSEAPAILHSLYAFNHRLADDGGEVLRDLMPHYAECKGKALEIAETLAGYVPVPIGIDLQMLYAMLEEGQIGQIQRLDAFPMSRRAGTDLGPFRSGIRRRLWAAQSVPF